MSSVSVGPSDLGIPSQRERRYSLRVRSSTGVLIAPLGEAFTEVAGRGMCMYADQFLRATNEDVKEFMHDMAAQRGIPPRVDGKCHKCMAVLSPLPGFGFKPACRWATIYHHGLA